MNIRISPQEKSLCSGWYKENNSIWICAS